MIHAGFGRARLQSGREVVDNVVRALAPEMSFSHSQRLFQLGPELTHNANALTLHLYLQNLARQPNHPWSRSRLEAIRLVAIILPSR